MSFNLNGFLSALISVVNKYNDEQFDKYHAQWIVRRDDGVLKSWDQNEPTRKGWTRTFEQGGEDDSSFWGELGEILYSNSLQVPDFGTVTCAEDHGGEGQGDDYYLVIRLTDEDGNESYVKRNGWYQSYDGGNYDGPTVLVEAIQKTITIYEEVK